MGQRQLLPTDNFISPFTEAPVDVISKDRIRLVGIERTAHGSGRGASGGPGPGGPTHIAAQNG